MANFTLLQVNLEKGSFNLPFSGGSKTTEDEESEPAVEIETEDSDDEGGRGKGVAVLGVLVFLVVAAALIKYLTGGDDDGDAVEIDTSDEPVGVPVDSDE